MRIPSAQFTITCLDHPFARVQGNEWDRTDEQEREQEDGVANHGEDDGVADLVHQGSEDDVAEHVAAAEDLDEVGV